MKWKKIKKHERKHRHKHKHILNDLFEEQKQIFDLFNTINSGQVDQLLNTLTPSGSIRLIDSKLIEENERYQKELVIERQKALNASIFKTKFLSSMGHEIRTPLNAILGATEVLTEMITEEEQLRFLSILKKAGITLLNRVNDILDFSKIESGELVIENIPFDLEIHIDDIVEMLANKAANKGLDYSYSIEPSLPASVIGDPLKIEQILINLIGNAIKFTEKGEVVLKIEWAQKNDNCDPTLDSILFSVRDTGIGIPEQFMKTIFNDFTQVDSTVTRKYGGAGLGLAIVKRLITKMQGKIWVESKIDNGSQFFFEIPFAKVLHTKKISDENIILKDKTVVLIGDNRSELEMLKKIIISCQGNIVDFISISMAIKCLKEESNFDLAIIDCRSHDLNGFELIRSLQETDLTKKIIVMLPFNHKASDLSYIQNLGIKTYIIKPIKRRHLLQAISSLLPGVQFIDNRSKKTLLVVDDERGIRNIFLDKKILSDVTVVFASTVREALTVLQANKVDAILSDFKMPGMTGLDLLTEMKLLKYKIPFVLMSGFIEEENIDKKIYPEITKFITKPFKIKEVSELIEQSLLGNKKKYFEDIQDNKNNQKEYAPLNILIAEDCEDNRVLMEAFLKRYPFNLTFVENGLDAISAFRNKKFDLILMDIQMPVMDGLTAVRKIREIEQKEKRRSTPIVAQTANSYNEEIENILASGCHGHLSKPIQKLELLKIIKTYQTYSG
ncbi:MAG: response regulator [Oligoflexia bacterium]|nr:response regulator [Oligoflexia bacterium]